MRNTLNQCNFESLSGPTVRCPLWGFRLPWFSDDEVWLCMGYRLIRNTQINTNPVAARAKTGTCGGTLGSLSFLEMTSGVSPYHRRPLHVTDSLVTSDLMFSIDLDLGLRQIYKGVSIARFTGSCSHSLIL